MDLLRGEDDVTCPQREIWAVEISESAGSRGNFEAFTLAVQDRVSSGNGSKIQVKLVAVTTSIPCGLGLSLPVSKMDRRSIKAHETKLFQNLAKPIMASPAGRKVKPKFVAVKNEKREEGLISFTRRSGAQRLYINTKTKDAIKELSLQMPSGCTVAGICGGKKIAEVTAAAIDVFDTDLDPFPGSLSDSANFSDSFTDFSLTLSEQYLLPGRTLPASRRSSFTERQDMEQTGARVLHRARTSLNDSSSRRLFPEPCAAEYFSGPMCQTFESGSRGEFENLTPTSSQVFSTGVQEARTPTGTVPELTRSNTWKGASPVSPDYAVNQQSYSMCFQMGVPLSPTILEGSALGQHYSSSFSPLSSSSPVPFPFPFLPTSAPMIPFSAPLSSLSIREEDSNCDGNQNLFSNDPRTHRTACFPLQVRGSTSELRGEEGGAIATPRQLTVNTDSFSWSVDSPWGVPTTPSSEQFSQPLTVSSNRSSNISQSFSLQPNGLGNLSHSLTLQPSKSVSKESRVHKSAPLSSSTRSPELRSKLKLPVTQGRRPQTQAGGKREEKQRSQGNGVMTHLIHALRGHFRKFNADDDAKRRPVKSVESFRAQRDRIPRQETAC